ncbi:MULTISPECIES: radical SAM protein [unclassified Thiocapsa]|uniref:radical SAM protein n=1 Tax=unclassified Thiocapsa TaxID=2641286 RepID=UPI0035B45528
MQQWLVDIRGQEAIVRLGQADGADPLPGLVDIEVELRDQQVRNICLELDPGVAVPVHRLSHLNYRELMPGSFVKTIPTRRAVRFSITEKCNYKCFFCHEEGLEMERVRQGAHEEQVCRVLDQMKALDYNDLTFTGGEPLLRWKQIVPYLAYMRRIDYLPDIKLVSNGLALQHAFLEVLQDYPGRIRFNISMHSLDPVLHDRIVRQLSDRPSRTHSDLNRIQANLGLLREAGIPFKLNFVLLKGLNTQTREIEAILAYGLESGARRVKFLELMITKKLKHLYPYYFRLQGLKDQLGDQLVYLEEGERRTLYRWRDSPLEVELQSCTCSRGCNVCALNRDVNFTAELRYFPCFLHPEQGSDLQVTPLAEAVAAGAASIAAMAQHYGDNSPIIIRDHYLTNQESFYYFEIPLDRVPALVEHLRAAEGLDLERHRTLTEIYFGDGSPAFAAFEYVHKLALNTYDHHAMAILQHHRVDPDGSGRIDTAFERDGERVPSVDTYAADMASKGFDVILKTDWALDYYAALGARKSGMTISIGTTPGRSSALLRSNRPLLDAPVPLAPLVALMQTVPAWLAGGDAS